MKLDVGDSIQVHGHMDIPLEDGMVYNLTGTEGQRYVFECVDTGATVQVPYPAVDVHIDSESYIERV